MMKAIFIISFFTSFSVLGQTSISCFSSQDLEKIENTLSKDPSDQHYSGLFGFYKKSISPQIINDCIYDHSCSKFSHDAFKKFGFVKGLVLTLDRLTRCNQAAKSEFKKVRLNKDQRNLPSANNESP